MCAKVGGAGIHNCRVSLVEREMLKICRRRFSVEAMLSSVKERGLLKQVTRYNIALSIAMACYSMNSSECPQRPPLVVVQCIVGSTRRLLLYTWATY